MSEHVQGKLLIIGGAEDKTGDKKILKRFVEEAGKKPVVVLTAATEYPRRVGAEYTEVLQGLGVHDVRILDVADRGQANSEEIPHLLTSVSGVFLTGGDQLRITGLLGGTLLGRSLHNLYEKGVIIAGTSAGASVMSDTMIVGGEAGTPRKNTLTMAPGLGLLRSIVVDQHFAQRGRIGRLLEAVAHNPYVLGIGIDEDTAILVHPDGRFSVVGSQTVTVIDASESVASNVSESRPGQPLVLSPVRMHVLPEEYEFDLRRRVFLPAG
ncbi:Peptidase family S51 [Acididesulfobacillus acetoxydans]|uniref:Cyanophycinase n=1 Tax=Acididesulfobacillus acetoxydans TaxID=1561005 RepID=A0A8S0Y1S4_9FIRM|nr:cyanophycinase [Acididesulfobacillus acetoxydans]CAA7599885.1 Peptidase family S51 [Acididesulfobacillus acetoxydans]CEJ06333.1 Cyanophycinase [Acididesulfobacillus acetoxydans]